MWTPPGATTSLHPANPPPASTIRTFPPLVLGLPEDQWVMPVLVRPFTPTIPIRAHPGVRSTPPAASPVRTLPSGSGPCPPIPSSLPSGTGSRVGFESPPPRRAAGSGASSRTPPGPASPCVPPGPRAARPRVRFRTRSRTAAPVPAAGFPPGPSRWERRVTRWGPFPQNRFPGSNRSLSRDPTSCSHDTPETPVTPTSHTPSEKTSIQVALTGESHHSWDGSTGQSSIRGG